MAKTALLVCLASLAAIASAHRNRRPAGRIQVPHLHRAGLASIPMRTYAQDCWKRRPAALSLSTESVRAAEKLFPGAGMDPKNIKPFETVLRDGFFEVTCIQDYVLMYGDKFGDGKSEYKLGDVSNVSIVRYDAIIAKEDRRPMSHEVCFEFCRTVPDMFTFGLTNGRDCYCAPFFTAMASDSGSCDELCEGETTQLCGGKLKSSIFEMHECEDTLKNLIESSEKAAEMAKILTESLSEVTSLADAMQDTAAALQEALGEVGDPTAANLMQEAKVFAGELLATASGKKTAATKLEESSKEALGMEREDFRTTKAASKAEALVSSTEKLIVDAEDAVEELDALAKKTSPSSAYFNNTAGAASQYKSLMYFVDTKYVESPTTCGGAKVGSPLVKLSADECANACDAEVESCVGFSLFSGPSASKDATLCFLFSKFEEVTYYTGCEKAAFLQKSQAALEDALPPMACMAKLSRFVGTTVKPDPSGKCKGCLKKATEAKRCPKVG